MKALRFLCASVALAMLMGGCADVKPWEKGNLAKSHMSFDPDPAESHFMHKTYQAKEASSGGYSIGGGGCGCN